jgi:hypothetical protein
VRDDEQRLDVSGGFLHVAVASLLIRRSRICH